MDLLPEGPSQKKPVILPCYKKPNLKKKKCSNCALLPQHVEMQCEKGIKPPTHTNKRGKMTGTALAKPPIYRLPIIWATLTHNSGKYLREQVRKAERRHWNRDKRDTILN